MKKLNLILVMMLLISSNVFAQWNTGGNWLNAFGATDWNLLGTNNIRSIGIGHKQMFGGFIEGWTTGNPPRAALHVNDFYLDDPQSWVFTPGHVFRTDGPSNQDNMWQMFTGNNYGNSTEKARLYVPANSQHFSLQSSTGDMRFHTGGTTQRMRILGSNGFVGIGQNFSNPLSLLHIDGSQNNTGEVFRTNSAVGQNSFWRMFMKNLEVGDIFSIATGDDIDVRNLGIQATEKDISFHTRPLSGDIGEERMRIVGEEHQYEGVTVAPGNLGIGTKHPYSMLHIGGDGQENSGYREWMNIGTFYNSEDQLMDNMYVGLYDTDNIDVNDAVINWGNNPTTQPGDADRLRFIFTAYPDLGLPASEDEGLEIARMISNGTTGRMGIGDFFSLGDDPSHTLDVLGNARLRELPENQWQGDFNKFVVIDEEGVLHWRSDIGPGETLGNICGSTQVNPLDDDWEIPLDGHNFVFSGQANDSLTADEYNVGIGTSCTPNAKLDIVSTHGKFGVRSRIQSGILNANAIKGESIDSKNQIGVYGRAENGESWQCGVKGKAIGIGDQKSTGVRGEAIFDATNVAIEGNAESIADQNYGGYFRTSNAHYNHGIYSRVQGDSNTTENRAGTFSIPDNSQGSFNYGIYCTVPDQNNSYAAHFNGSVEILGDLTVNGVSIPSDQQFKQNIESFNGALDLVRELRPVTFNYDTVNYDLNFPSGMQCGLIAQEVEEDIPLIVSNEVIPPEFDTVGNIIRDSINYKGINYIGLTPILTQAIREVDSNLNEIVSLPISPSLIAPDDNQTIKFAEPVNFLWNEAGNTTHYVLEFSYNSDMSNLFSSEIIYDTTFTTGFKFPYDTTLYWSVKSVNAFGNSEYSEIRSLDYMYGYEKKMASSYSELSDVNLKTNINNIDDALNRIMQLQGVNFEWDVLNHPDRNLEAGHHLGMIAQDVEPVFPEVVNTDTNGFMYIDYSSMVPVLIEAAKQLKNKNDSLAGRLNSLEDRVDELEENLNCFDTSDNQFKNAPAPEFTHNIELDDPQAIVLNQNVPNPFKEKTTISFSIPENVGNARIVFISNSGAIIKQVEIHERGNGELVVYANNLSAGLYTYYLVADGKTIESKKMLLSLK